MMVLCPLAAHRLLKLSQEDKFSLLVALAKALEVLSPWPFVGPKPLHKPGCHQEEDALLGQVWGM